MKIYEKAPQRKIEDIAVLNTNLARTLQKQGKYTEAGVLLKRALNIFEDVEGPDGESVAVALFSLSFLYYVQGNFAEAESLCRRSLAIRQTAYGLDHPNVALDLLHLATLYTSQGKYVEADSLYRRSFEIFENVYETEHRSIATTYNNYGLLLRAQSKYTEAGQLFRRAIEISEKILGPTHYSVATHLNHLADLCSEQGRYSIADSLVRRCLEIREKSFGADYPDVARSLNSLAQIRFLAGGEEFNTVLPIIERAIRIWNSTTESPTQRIKACALRAQLRRQQGDWNAATADLAEALRSAESLRPQIGGGEETRAGFFEQYSDYFNWMVAWQLEAGRVEKFAERSRARVMLDQLAAGKIDLRNCIPDDIRTPLEKRETDAKARLAEYQQRFSLLRSRKDLSDRETARQLVKLQDSLKVPDRDYQQVYEEIKNASPLWRDLITSGGQPVSLASIQHELVSKSSLMLLYQVGNDSSYLFIVPPAGQQPEVMALQITVRHAPVLNVKAGPLKSSDL